MNHKFAWAGVGAQHSPMIARDLAPLLRRAAATMPVVMLTGPRQSGKTTLCRALFSTHVYRTLEAPDARAFALGDPRGFLAELADGADGVVIDEIQRAPALLPYLRGTADDDSAPGRWILVDSRNLLLPESTPESIGRSLAGRIELYQLPPLTWGEVLRCARPPASLDEALFTGSYPEILDQALHPTTWHRTYAGRYLDRDVRTIVNVRNLATFQRFGRLRMARITARNRLTTYRAARSALSALETCLLPSSKNGG